MILVLSPATCVTLDEFNILSGCRLACAERFCFCFPRRQLHDSVWSPSTPESLSCPGMVRLVCPWILGVEAVSWGKDTRCPWPWACACLEVTSGISSWIEKLAFKAFRGIGGWTNMANWGCPHCSYLCSSTASLRKPDCPAWPFQPQGLPQPHSHSDFILSKQDRYLPHPDTSCIFVPPLAFSKPFYFDIIPTHRKVARIVQRITRELSPRFPKC